MSRTETFWKPCRAKSRSAAPKTAAFVAAWVSSSRFWGASFVMWSVIWPRLAGELLHGLLKPTEGQREHAVAHQLFDDADRGRVVPMPLGGRVQPDHVLVDVGHAVQPDGAGFLVPVLHRAAGIGDFVGAHGRVADEDDLVVVREFVEHVPG